MARPLLESLPKELKSRSERVARVVSNPVTPQRFIMGPHGYVCANDLEQAVLERSSMSPMDHLRAKRLQLTKSNFIGDASTNSTKCLQYNEILFRGSLQRMK
mmetsp:Transcript_10254/g.18503  ORF Transcript_10254/g.18503 Transcript_10254/m.18503 type:complete len:102 (+) Transcript_10254:125-430(+)